MYVFMIFLGKHLQKQQHNSAVKTSESYPSGFSPHSPPDHVQLTNSLSMRCIN